MIELPEALTLAKELTDTVVGKTVVSVSPPTKPHKFCWWNGDPMDYEEQIRGCKITSAEGFGIFAELTFDNGKKLCVNDGVNIRLLRESEIPKDYQLKILFDGGEALVLTVAMYGGIVLFGNHYDNEYYLKSKSYISPFSEQFEEHYYSTLEKSKPSLSAKAFLATEQRFPGIGNGVLQDILFSAGIHPKRKILTLDAGEREKLLKCTVSVLSEMTRLGGRDTEKDIYGTPGGYKTVMSKSGAERGCPLCLGGIVKEAYLGGSVYYCPNCQK